MKKDIVYTIRMSRSIRDALRMAAERDRRSVASLLDKIIIDYLEKEGFSAGDVRSSEDRRGFPRKKITLPGTTYVQVGSEEKSFPAVILDISMGGVLITFPKGSQFAIPAVGELPRFRLCFQLPRTEEQVCLNCDTRRISDTGSEIHVGATFGGDEDHSRMRLQGYLM